MSSYDESLSASIRWPTNLRRWKGGEDVGFCCRLHSGPVGVKNVYCPGCAEASIVGVHPAILDRDKGGAIVCHADTGQLVLDRVLASGVLTLEARFVHQFLRPTAKFMKKYCAGGEVDPAVYGNGYCYLHMFRTKGRHRVARCLGPLPLLADVIRFMFAMTEPMIPVNIIDHGEVLHVELSGVMVSSLEIIRRLTVLVNTRSSIRIGGVTASIAEETVRGPTSFDVEKVFEYDPKFLEREGYRAPGLKSWLQDTVSFEVDDTFLKFALVVTCAPAMFSSYPFIKDKIKLLAIVGDGMLKVCQAEYCIKSGANPAKYNSMSAVTTNVAMAALLDSSGVRQHCSVEYLSVGSKANATILEALVGLVHAYYGMDIVRTFVYALELCPDGTDLAAFQFSSFDGIQGLNSREYELAIKARGG